MWQCQQMSKLLTAIILVYAEACEESKNLFAGLPQLGQKFTKQSYMSLIGRKNRLSQTKFLSRATSFWISILFENSLHLLTLAISPRLGRQFALRYHDRFGFQGRKIPVNSVHQKSDTILCMRICRNTSIRQLLLSPILGLLGPTIRL